MENAGDSGASLGPKRFEGELLEQIRTSMKILKARGSSSFRRAFEELAKSTETL